GNPTYIRFEAHSVDTQARQRLAKVLICSEAAQRSRRRADDRTGLPVNAPFPYGRDRTSTAFLSTAGTERLYSGVRKRTASASRICCRTVRHAEGGSLSNSSL